MGVKFRLNVTKMERQTKNQIGWPPEALLFLLDNHHNFGYVQEPNQRVPVMPFHSNQSGSIPLVHIHSLSLYRTVHILWPMQPNMETLT